MRNIYLIFGALVILVNGCTKEVNDINPPSMNNETLTLKVSIPETRLVMTQEGLNVGVTWETTDELHLCFIDGATKKQATGTVGFISESGKQATFTFPIPDGINQTQFQLKGVVGAKLSSALGEEDVVLLPNTTWSGASLNDIQTKKLHVATFTTDVNLAEDTEINVNLEHLGSLFSIRLTNNGDPRNDIKVARLKATSAIPAYTGGGKYNISSNTFSDMTDAGNTFALALNEAPNLPNGATTEFWGWFIPTGGTWPEFSVELLDGTNTILASTGDTTKPSRPAPAAGKAIYIDAYVSGSNLAFEPIPDANIIVNGGFEEPLSYYSLLPNIHGTDRERLPRGTTLFATTSATTFPTFNPAVPITDYAWFQRTSNNNRWFLFTYIEDRNPASTMSNEVPNNGNKSLALYIAANEEKDRTHDFVSVLAQRVELDDTKKYNLKFFVQKDAQSWGTGAANLNYAEKLTIGITSSNDASQDYTYYVPYDLPTDGEWTEVNVPFDLPAIKAANPGKSFAKSAIFISLVPTQFTLNSSSIEVTRKHQVNIDDVSLIEIE